MTRSKRERWPAFFSGLLTLFACCAAHAEPTWFADAGAGRAYHDDPDLDADGGFLRVGGGVHFGEHLFLEAAFVDFASVSDRTLPPSTISLAQDRLEIEARGFTLAPGMRVRIHSRVEVSARIGVAVLDVDRAWSGGSLVDPVRAADDGGTDTDVFGGVRVGVELTETLELGVGWDRYSLESTDADVAHIGLRFLFRRD